MPADAHQAASSIAQRIVFPLAGDEAAGPLVLRVTAGDVSWTRTALRLEPRSAVRLDTYFAAFPAAWWYSHAETSSVRFRARVSGSLTLAVRSSDGAGTEREVFRGDVTGEVDVPAALDADSGWVWAVVESDDGATLEDARWEVAVSAMPTATVCITTHDRPVDCLGVLRRLADDEATRDLVRIVVVDQGSARLRDAEGFDRVRASLGGRLQLVEQANLGGSGGFSRGMAAAVDDGSDVAVLLDDDVILEPESLWRLLAFAGRATTPSIVGAQMLSLQDRTTLHAWGERVRARGFRWSPAPPELSSVDLATLDVTRDAGTVRVADVDYNGWWMCLIPTATIRMLGLALPLFIKWDDTEYALRARAAGVPTVTLPGAALWHMPWTGKDDGLDWQAYFQLRNRLLTAVLHGRPRGGGVLGATFAQDVNHVVCQQYGSAALRRLALHDVLAGPSELGDGTERLAEGRRLLAATGQLVVPLAATGDSGRASIAPAPSRPRGAVRRAGRAVAVLVHQVLPDPDHLEVGPVLDRTEAKWWSLGVLDAARVRSATGLGAFVSGRHRSRALALIRDAALLRVRLWWRWPGLARRWRAAAPGLASAESWRSRWGTSAADGLSAAAARDGS